MAEERIYIKKCGENNPCDTCEDTSGDECDFCVENYEWNASISRKEAINRIAKALCADDVMREGYYQMAEAALDALLEGKNED